MTPQAGEIWRARVMGVDYLLLELVTSEAWGGSYFKTLRLDTGVIEPWVVTDDHFRRVA